MAGAAGLSAAKRALLERTLRGDLARPEQRPAIPRRSGERPAPLSIGQEQLWFFSRLSPELGVYNEGATLRKRGPVDLDALRRAFDEVVRRHEIWRTSFPTVDGAPVQRVHPAPRHDLPLTDLTHLPAAEREAEAVRLATEDARRPYDLEAGPLVRPRLTRLADDDHRLYLAMHHIVFDGVSLYRVLLPEMVALYDAFAAGREPDLAELAIQYSDYAEWQQAASGRAGLEPRLDYWRRQLGGELPAQLPTDRERPPVQRFVGAIERLRIRREVVDALKALAHREGASLFMVLAAAFGVLLQRYSGQDDVVFGTPIDDRHHPELQSMIGFCLNAVVLRTDTSGDPTFRGLLARVREVTLAALANEVPFERLVRELQPQRDPSRNPLFQVMLGIEPPLPPVDPDWSLHQMDVGVGTSKFDLYLEQDERPDGDLSCRFVYDADLFEAGTIARLTGHWLTLLEGVVAEPDRPISRLPLLTEPERRLLLDDWNATARDYPRERCAHELVAEQAARTPEAVAVVFGDERLTYRELDARAGRLAERLRSLGVAPGAAVGLAVERSAGMVVGALAILRAGGAYLPLDPRYPAGRLARMLEDSGAAVLVTQTGLKAELPAARRVIRLDVDAEPADGPAAPAPAAVRPGDPAYVIYTSGSTGRPKGVRVPHRALVNFLASMAAEPGLAAGDVLVAVTTLSFDIAGLELWLPLTRGATVVVADAETTADGVRLAGLLAAAGATVMQATPATWRMLVDSGWAGSPGLTALCGGEPLPPDLAGELLDRCGRLCNLYGPTETTIWSTLAQIERGRPVSIGRPIANTRVYVLDRAGEPAPVGVPGELCIGGDGVADGYVGRPGLTAERFVPDPFAPAPARVYRTGDLARWRPDGTLECLGRLDDQVKIRGHRVELGEVEAALAGHPGVAAAVASAREERPGERSLVAYVVPSGGAAPDAAELREHLRATLPEYMLPSTVVALDALPLTANGKVDRRALPAPGPGSYRGPAAGHVAPRTPAEEALAQIWRGSLGLERVGVRDNFFELGGHSLLAVRVLGEVERVFGRRPPLASFFREGVTIEGQARVLEEEIEAGASALLVRVNPRGSRPPVFFVFSDDSAMLALRHFLPAFGADQPVYGLLPEQRRRRFDRTRRLEDLAADLRRVVRVVQPRGPYYVCGHSFGGLVAYELAARLRADGERVGLLAIIDAMTPAAVSEALREWMRPRARLGRQVRRGLRAGGAKLWEVADREARAALSRLLRAAEPPLQGSEFDYDGAIALAQRYRVVGNDVPVAVFRTPLTDFTAGGDSLGWREVHRGALECQEVPGDHLSMLQAPNVAILADRLAARLRAAQARAAPPRALAT